MEGARERARTRNDQPYAARVGASNRRAPPPSASSSLGAVDLFETTELETFVASAQRVVDYLNARTPLTDWSVSRVAGDEQVHLHVRGQGVLNVGDRVPWQETFCRRMLAGAANPVRDAARDPGYADLPAAAEIRAYAGVPIHDGDGSLFGTLCGVGVEPLDPEQRIDRELLDVFSQLLSDQLVLVRAVATHLQSARLAEALASTDRLTGLMNRRGWDLLLGAAQDRVDALGDRAAVLMIDLDDLKTVNDSGGHHAGDALLVSAATALQGAVRESDVVARYGGDEFAVFVDAQEVTDLATVAAHYAGALESAGVAASVGAAPVLAGDGPGTGVQRALAEADAAMYAAKLRRRAGSPGRGGPR